MLDGQQLPTSALPGSGSIISAVIDTVITSLCTADRILMLTPIEGKRSNPGAEGYCRERLEACFICVPFYPNVGQTFPCAVPHELAFQIGGKTFPIDPRDFMSQTTPLDARTCVASSIVITDPPSHGALFSWSLGAPFFTS